MTPIAAGQIATELPSLLMGAGREVGSLAKESVRNAASVAKEFEGVFASLVLKEMRQSLADGSLFGEDSGDVFGGLFDQFLGQNIAKSGGFGMAQLIQRGIERTESTSS